MADARLLVAIVLSLLISSVCIAFVTGEQSATLGETTLYKPISQNVTGNNTIAYTIDSISLGDFEKTENGFMSTTEYENTIYFVTRWANNAVYTNSYGIYNPDALEYFVIVRETDLFSDTLQVRVNDIGITIECKALLGYRPYEVYTPYDISVHGDSYVITTTLDETERTITVYIDGVEVASAFSIPEDSIFSILPVKYSGISVTGTGFYITELSSNAQSLDEASFDMWAFFSALGGVLGWYTSSGNAVVDIFINLIIKIQQFAIVVVAITIIRGN